jgi:hypothetical protein
LLARDDDEAVEILERAKAPPEHLPKLRVSSRAAATAFAFEHELV